MCARALGVKLNNNGVKLNKLLFMCKFECARIQVASTSISPEVFGKKEKKIFKKYTCSRVLENTVLYPPSPPCVVDRRIYQLASFPFLCFFYKKKV